MSGPAEVVVRYWAAAKAAAGAPDEGYAGPSDLGELLEAIRARHGADSRLADVLARCSYLVDEVSPGRRAPADVPLAPGAVVDVLPPFAGGSAAAAPAVAGTPVPRRGLGPS
jgi:molybdopterin converting factor small subunit